VPDKSGRTAKRGFEGNPEIHQSVLLPSANSQKVAEVVLDLNKGNVAGYGGVAKILQRRWLGNSGGGCVNLNKQ
jgi:hypothetical protein